MDTVSGEPNNTEGNSKMDSHFHKLMGLLSTSEFLASTLKLQINEVRKSSMKNVSTDSTINDEVSTKGNNTRKRKILSELHPREPKKHKPLSQVSNAPNYNPQGTKGQVSDKQPILFEGGVLHDYQLEGLTWLQCMYKNALNGILADEMGLGKTLQVIAFICHLIEKKVVGPYLILAPLSTLPNWVSEFQKFAPKVPVILVHGNKQERLSAFKNVHSLKTINKTMKSFPVVLTSFEVPLLNKNQFRKTKWHYIIVDEGHRLKNHDCQLTRELQSYDSDNRLLLTGTPLQNNLAELWSLLNFVLPEVFNDLTVFEDWFEISELEQHVESNEQLIRQEQKTKVLNAMHKILDTFLLRRVKDDVQLNLPPKKEILVYCKLSELQLRLYQATVTKTLNQFLIKTKFENEPLDGNEEKKPRCCAVNKSYKLFYKDFEDLQLDENIEDAHTSEENTDDGYKIYIKMQNSVMQLRNIVNHPYLVQMPIDKNRHLIVNEELVTNSGKLLVLDALLVKLKNQGHKVLIFSNFTSMLDILEDYLLMRKYKYCRLDGHKSFLQRAQDIKSFNNDSDVFAFLISTRAGSLGLNLTAADTVIIYDSDWNPQVDLQAQDRCHRIGQTKPVLVYRLIGQGTVDEKIVRRAAAKRKLEKLVILEGKFNKFSKLETVLDIKELKKMLESTDHYTKVHSNGYVLTDDELEKLLDRGE